MYGTNGKGAKRVHNVIGWLWYTVRVNGYTHILYRSCIVHTVCLTRSFFEAQRQMTQNPYTVHYLGILVCISDRAYFLKDLCL